MREIKKIIKQSKLKYGEDFYYKEDYKDNKLVALTVFTKKIKKELEEVFFLKGKVFSLEETLEEKFEVGELLNIFTQKKEESSCLADQLHGGEIISTIENNKKGEEWLPILVRHDFEDLASCELGWIREIDLNKVGLIKEKNSLLKRTCFSEEVERFLGLGTKINYCLCGKSYQDGFDCSGFVQTVFRNVYNIHLPRLARWQFLVGQEVLREDLQKEDLIFFANKQDQIDHVGIVLSTNGTNLPTIIHCTSRVNGIIVENLSQVKWLGDEIRIKGFKRI